MPNSHHVLEQDFLNFIFMIIPWYFFRMGLKKGFHPLKNKNISRPHVVFRLALNENKNKKKTRSRGSNGKRNYDGQPAINYRLKASALKIAPNSIKRAIRNRRPTSTLVPIEKSVITESRRCTCVFLYPQPPWPQHQVSPSKSQNVANKSLQKYLCLGSKNIRASARHSMTHGYDLNAWRKKWRACSGEIGVMNALVIWSVKACRTFSLCSRTVWVAQREQGHLDQLVEEHVLPHQNKLSMFLFAVKLDGALVVLHHTKHWQHVT